MFRRNKPQDRQDWQARDRAEAGKSAASTTQPPGLPALANWRMTHFVKCPSCKNELREKGAGSMTVDVCYGGCGGIWFDRSELERVDARSASTLHTIWSDPNKSVLRTGTPSCP